MKVLVTQSFLPPLAEYTAMIEKIWDNHWLTNNGPLLVELETKLKELLALENLLFVGNGTIAIQLAIKALQLKGEIITTPYSYCATTTTILWENCTPRYADINQHDLNINADKIEELINEDTSAILATHVYGFPCDVEKIATLGKKYNIPVIYDAAHAFGVKYQGKSLFAYGDVSTCSFHATKVYHSIEGGLVVTQNVELIKNISLLRSFGHVNDDYKTIGINGKNSEFHAAMGLCNLKYFSENIRKRRLKYELYDSLLDFKQFTKPYYQDGEIEWNYAYYPLIFNSKEKCEAVIEALNKEDIFPRRYFYPSLNTLEYTGNKDICPISESVVNRVLSLPFHPDLEDEIIHKIAAIINLNA